ncbi:hypothetical protein Tco_1263123 [Tanacetum coccineum]
MYLYKSWAMNQLWQLQLSLISSDSSWIAPVTSTMLLLFLLAAPYVLRNDSCRFPPTGLCDLVPYTGSDSDSPDEIRRRSATSYPTREAIPFGQTLPAHHLNRAASSLHLLHIHLSDSSQFKSFWVLDAPIRLILELRLGDVSTRLCYRLRGEHHVYEAFRRWTMLVQRVKFNGASFRGGFPRFGLTGTGVDMELGIGDGDEVGDHVEIDDRDARDDTEEYEADASAGDTTEAGIDPMTAPLVEEEIVEPVGEDSPDSPDTRDGIVRSVEDTPVDLSDAVRDFYHHMSEVRVDRIVGIETAQRRLEADQLIASGDRARMAEAIYSLRMENLKVRAMLDIERDRVSSLRLHMSLSQEEFRQIRRDRDDARTDP